MATNVYDELRGPSGDFARQWSPIIGEDRQGGHAHARTEGDRGLPSVDGPAAACRCEAIREPRRAGAGPSAEVSEVSKWADVVMI